LSSSEKKYKELYNLQDKVLSLLKGKLGEFYLTGGTALGRYYLNHRYSEDLDFFTHTQDTFLYELQRIRNIIDSEFITNSDKMILTDEYARIWVIEQNIELKIDFVKDVPYHWMGTNQINEIKIDNPGNILSNKLSAIVNRDEPKDVFDIVSIALNFSFNWDEVFTHSIKKAVVSETDVAIRLNTFPEKLLGNVDWMKNAINISDFKHKLLLLSEDFLFARDNSLGSGKINLIDAVIEGGNSN
jgi:predicted nucleotidyltransferase component of viral defense system